LLDNWGLVGIDAQKGTDLLTIIDDRVGRRALLITRQLPTTAWHAWLDEPTLADAIVAVNLL